MRLYQLALSVPDLDLAEGFYRDVLGARFVARFDPPGLVFFDLDGVRLLIESGEDDTGGNSVLYLWTDDIEARVAELQGKGVEFRSGPHAIHHDEAGTFGPPGETEWMAFFEDPAGNVLALVTRKLQAP